MRVTQPQTQPRINYGSPIARRRWACVHVPGRAAFGTANPVGTLGGAASYMSGRGGSALNIPLKASYTNGTMLSYGANASMQLSVSSGLIVFDYAERSFFFGTNITGAASSPSNGFAIYPLSTGAIEMDKMDTAAILVTGNTAPIRTVSACAWSYNSSTGRARIALNGVLSSASSAQTFTHGTCALGGYYTDNSLATGYNNIYLFALSPDEVMSDAVLIESSLRPWQLFTEQSARIYSFPTFNPAWNSAANTVISGGAIAA